MPQFKSLAKRALPTLAAVVKAALREREYLRASPVESPHGFLLAGSDFQAVGFEVVELEVARHQLSVAKTFVDIGANVGLYTMLAQQLGVRTIAIEPSQQNLRHLYRNLLLNGHDHVEVFPVALNTEPGLLKLYNQGTGASLIPGWAGTSGEVTEVVPALTLTQIFAAAGICDEHVFVKMDVEGAEMAVLAGAIEVLDRPATTWLVEVNLTAHHPSGRHPDYEAVFDAWFSRGFDCLDVVRNVPVTAAEVAVRAQAGVQPEFPHNFLFARP